MWRLSLWYIQHMELRKAQVRAASSIKLNHEDYKKETIKAVKDITYYSIVKANPEHVERTCSRRAYENQGKRGTPTQLSVPALKSGLQMLAAQRTLTIKKHYG
jgi:hypothetical protein